MLKGEARKKKEFKSGSKHSSKQAYTLNFNGLDSSTPWIGQTGQHTGKQGGKMLVWTGLSDCLEIERVGQIEEFTGLS